MKTLPLIDSVQSDCTQNITWSDVAIIACQPLLRCTQAMFTALIAAGLSSDNIFCIGKCYSSNAEVISSLISQGIYVYPDTLLFDSHESFDAQFQMHLTKFFLRILELIQSRRYKRIVLLDDGGSLIHLASSHNIASECVAVEQTSSGFNLLKNCLTIPIINVARSKAKLGIEAPLIATAIIEKLETYLTVNNLQYHQNLLILGKGIIGSSIGQKIKKGNIRYYDNKVNTELQLIESVKASNIIYRLFRSNFITQTFT